MPSLFSSRAAFRIGISLVVSALWLGSCADPTEIRLHVFTNVRCPDPTTWKGVAVYVGRPDGSLEDKAATLTSTVCDQNGQVGSLVVVPSGSKDDEVGLRVVAGLNRNPEDCATHRYQGCIVARRALRFSRHAALDLDVDLNSACSGVACDPAHTCVDGTCVDTHETQPVELVDAEAPKTVRCGDNGIVCPTTGNVCCLTVDKNAGTSSGECKDPAQCASTSIVLNCDDDTDCTALTDDAGRPGMCMIAYTQAPGTLFTPSDVSSAQCVNHAGTAGIPYWGLELCQTRKPCLNGLAECGASEGKPPSNPLPGYFYCIINTQ